jgi:hypothetical protein
VDKSWRTLDLRAIFKLKGHLDLTATEKVRRDRFAQRIHRQAHRFAASRAKTSHFPDVSRLQTMPNRPIPRQLRAIGFT